MTPFFSIIIPAYNVENYIERAISSVLNQSFQDFEIIIVNDGSVDKTADIIDGYAQKNENIKVVNHLKNDSLHIARLDGVAASNGQYVVFLDADDYFTDNALNILFDEIQKNTGYDFYEYGYIEQPSGNVIFPSFTEEDRFSACFSKDKYPAHTMWNKVYESNLLKKAFTSLERIYINNAEDIYESIVISYYTKNIYIINKVIINYSIGTGISTTYKDYEKTLLFMQSIKTMLNLVENFIKKTNQNVDLNNLKYKILNYLFINFINTQKNEKDKFNLYLKINDYFNSEIILEYLFYNSRYLSQKKEEVFLIRNSIDYRLGHKLLNPLRKIKRLFHK
jgi:glycosyltransferase involved in cell wall biosynthesis